MPVTVIEAGCRVVVQKKTTEKMVTIIKVGFGDIREVL